MSDEYVVEITEPLNPIKCANLMHPYLKKGEPVTPEFCRQLLRSSNHRKIMRDMLTLIDARLEKNPDDYWVYREILYGIFCGRRQIDEIINKTAEITVKYINLEKADKTDRALIADLAKENLSAENMLRVKRLAEKIYQKIPVDKFLSGTKIMFFSNYIIKSGGEDDKIREIPHRIKCVAESLGVL